MAKCHGESLSTTELSRSMLTDDVSYFRSMSPCIKGAIEDGSLSDPNIPFLSAQVNSVEVLRYFIQEGLVSTSATNAVGRSIVEVALLSGSYGTTLLLLRHGAEIDPEGAYASEGLRMLVEQSVFLQKRDIKEREELLRYLSENKIIPGGK